MDLIDEIKNDIEKGSVRLFAEYRDRLYFEAMRLCDDAAAADDLVMLAFDRAIRKIDSYDSRKSEFFTWLKAILLNCNRDGRRRFAATHEHVGEADDVAERNGLIDTSTEDDLFRRSEADALRQAIGSLKRDEREMILMHYFGEMSVGEIAKFIHASNWAVQWRLRMARKALAKKLAPVMKKSAVAVAALAAVVGLLTIWFSPSPKETVAASSHALAATALVPQAGTFHPREVHSKVGRDYARQFGEPEEGLREENL